MRDDESKRGAASTTSRSRRRHPRRTNRRRAARLLPAFGGIRNCDFAIGRRSTPVAGALAIVDIKKHSDAHAYRTLALHTHSCDSSLLSEPLSAHAADIARVVSERPERALPLWRTCVTEPRRSTEELVLARCAAI